jgi:alkanesulfonate monooxygenase SsuD/methylene tetrahydromethanopterin reductase-like flavin-dependent oxidoreductase (luciferase family)
MGERKFGIFDHMERREGESVTDLFEGRLQLLEAADAAGIYAYHLAEHHATRLGMAPSPSVFLSAVAQRTTRLRFGPLLYVLPLYEPLRLIEEIGMLDQLSNGRLELGVGRGASVFELAYYNVPFLESKYMFEEAIEVLKKGLREDRLNHAGEKYVYRDVPMEVPPVQKPNPPFWFGAFTPANAEFAGNLGMNAVCGGTNTMVKDMKAVYDTARASARGTERDLNPHVDTPLFGAFRHVFVADTDQQADEIATPAYKIYYENLMKLWRDFNTVNTLFTPDLGEAKAYDVAWSGSPETVAAQINRYFEDSGTNYLVLAVAWGSLTAEQSRRSFDLLTDQVIPAVVEA